VKAASVEVRGHLDGHISADRVELGPTAVVTASVVAAKLVLHDGAQLTGPVNTDRAQAAVSVARHRQKA
jgi:cytoskeletal protein CcmA (bactofilin family)